MSGKNEHENACKASWLALEKLIFKTGEMAFSGNDDGLNFTLCLQNLHS